MGCVVGCASGSCPVLVAAGTQESTLQKGVVDKTLALFRLLGSCQKASAMNAGVAVGLHSQNSQVPPQKPQQSRPAITLVRQLHAVQQAAEQGPAGMGLVGGVGLYHQLRCQGGGHVLVDAFPQAGTKGYGIKVADFGAALGLVVVEPDGSRMPG